MPAPSLITSVQISSPWSQAPNVGIGVSTINYASTVTTTAGDLLVGLQGGADSAITGAITLTDGVNTYNPRTSSATASHCSIYIGTATDGAGGTRTLTWNRTSSSVAIQAGGIVFQFRDHGGVGNVFTATDGVQTGNLTCSANSAILVICTDWNAVNGSRTWATINGASPTIVAGVDGDLSTWAAAVAYFADVGSAGSKSITLTAPTFTAASFAAIEILAGAGGGGGNTLMGQVCT